MQKQKREQELKNKNIIMNAIQIKNLLYLKRNILSILENIIRMIILFIVKNVVKDFSLINQLKLIMELNINININFNIWPN